MTVQNVHIQPINCIPDGPPQVPTLRSAQSAVGESGL